MGAGCRPKSDAHPQYEMAPQGLDSRCNTSAALRTSFSDANLMLSTRLRTCSSLLPRLFSKTWRYATIVETKSSHTSASCVPSVATSPKYCHHFLPLLSRGCALCCLWRHLIRVQGI